VNTGAKEKQMNNQEKAQEIKDLAEKMKEFNKPLTVKGAPRPTQEQVTEYNQMRLELGQKVQALAKELAAAGTDVNAEFVSLGVAEVLGGL
jgi:hypothetical protein